MIPKRMEAFLRERLPQQHLGKPPGARWRPVLHGVQRGGCGPPGAAWASRWIALGRAAWCACGTRASPLEVGGYLVIDNLAMGRPSMGGIRMLPEITPPTVRSLARGMTLKNAAANLPFGGGKVGIVAERSLTPAEHSEVVRCFARLLSRYRDRVPARPGCGHQRRRHEDHRHRERAGHRRFQARRYGRQPRRPAWRCRRWHRLSALQALLEEMPRLKALPQFASLEIPAPDELTVLIQGFGAVGAHTARMLCERMPGVQVIGISDAQGYLYDPERPADRAALLPLAGARAR